MVPSPRVGSRLSCRPLTLCWLVENETRAFSVEFVKSNDYLYEPSIRKLLSLRMPDIPQDLPQQDRLNFFSSLLPLEQTQMVCYRCCLAFWGTFNSFPDPQPWWPTVLLSKEQGSLKTFTCVTQLTMVFCKVVNELESSSEPVTICKISLLPMTGALRVDLDTLKVPWHHPLKILANHRNRPFRFSAPKLTQGRPVLTHRNLPFNSLRLEMELVRMGLGKRRKASLSSHSTAHARPWGSVY